MNRIETLDCKNCTHKDTCERYKEGTFCTKFQSHPTERTPKKSPGERGAYGEDSDGW
jgi:hypothetical protein